MSGWQRSGAFLLTLGIFRQLASGNREPLALWAGSANAAAGRQ